MTKIEEMTGRKKGKRRTIRYKYEPDECRLFYTYTIIARLHTNHI